jgi:hypothetical protein
MRRYLRTDKHRLIAPPSLPRPNAAEVTGSSIGDMPAKPKW